MRKMLFTVIVLVAIASDCTSYAEVKIMPDELVEFAERNSCSQLLDFFEKNPGPVNPPYVYGYASKLGESSPVFWDSAAFWCGGKESGKEKYYLMFKFKDSSHELAKCPYKIEWGGYPQGGLSIYKDRKTTLEGFVYLENEGRSVPENVRLTHNGILISSGVEALLYCHKGKWLIRTRD